MRPECQESHQCRLRWGRWRWRRWQSQGRRERQGRWSSWSRWTWGLIIQSVVCAKKNTLQLALPPRRHLPCKLRDQDTRPGWLPPQDGDLDDVLIFLFESTNHIVDSGKDDGGQLGSVAPLRDEGEGEGVHKQLMTVANWPCPPCREDMVRGLIKPVCVRVLWGGEG